MAKRQFDLLFGAIGLILAAPLLAVAGAGIALSSRGPVIYKCKRVGRHGKLFTMYKLRTMHVEQGVNRSRISGLDDPRVFAFGRLLRRAKIDELPQLVNVLRGEMSIVGPRPEDPAFVARHYAPEHKETLELLPGLASPGSIYSSTHGERFLGGDRPEARYLELVLPLKLALDRVYVRRASVTYDLAIIGRTIVVIAALLAGRRHFGNPPEIHSAWRLLVPARHRDPDADAAMNRVMTMRAVPASAFAAPREMVS